MKLLLKKTGQLVVDDSSVSREVVEGYQRLKVLFCAICRTDAKMWRDGHRDLLLPRVLGHEIAAVDEEDGTIYTVWPGQSCGNCNYCRQGRENLCEEMKIIGFHSDGGFAQHILAPKESLIKAPEELKSEIVTFAEPAGCVINSLDMVSPTSGERAIVYGGGTVGMLAALMLKSRGCAVTVIEQSEEKIGKLKGFARNCGLELCKDSAAADFDLAINCCTSHIAFSLCITKLCKGGRLAFFSGLTKNEEIDTNLLNLIHYKELVVTGSYGPKRSDMERGLLFCAKHQVELSNLIERIVRPDEVQGLLPPILDGKLLKCIVKLGGSSELISKEPLKPPENFSTDTGTATVPSQLAELVAEIQPTDRRFSDQAQKKVDLKTKPLGALGRLESLAVKISTIQKSLDPQVDRKQMFVFAGDHGVVEEGVSAFPAKVTIQMVENFLEGGAAINVFCNQYMIDLSVVDMGVAGDFEDHPLLVKKKVGYGTNNFAITDAMSEAQAIQTILSGADCFYRKHNSQPFTIVGLGEMGIGNTSSATAIICAATGTAVKDIVGRGTGVDDSGLQRKREVLEKALQLHNPNGQDGLELLRTVGGYELGGICGAVLAAASRGCCVVLDGIISTAAGLLAYLICPAVKDYLISGHRSVEVGQKTALELMGLEPVLDLDFRLGEGTGAAITMNLADLACSMMRDMASFDEAGVDSGSIEKGA